MVPGNRKEGMNPLLSVCIPTYNRSSWLKSSLGGWLPQVREFRDSVELIVSDDASGDRTAEVAEEAKRIGPLSYYRNETNIGMFSNYASLVEKARGEFIWMAGDDAVPRSVAVEKLIKALGSNPELDLFCVNHNAWSPRNPPKEMLRADDFSLDYPMVEKTEDMCADRIADILRYDLSCLSFSHSVVWRRSLAGGAFPRVEQMSYHTSLETAFPHAAYLARHLSNKPAYYIGYPLIVNSVNPAAFSWSNHFHITYLRWLPDLVDEFVKGGVPMSTFALHKKRYLAVCGEFLKEMLTDCAIPRRQFFSVARFARQHWLYADFYKLCLNLMKRAVRRQYGRLVPVS